MSPDENKALVLRLLDEAFNKGNTAPFLENVAPGAVGHMAGYPEPFHGPEGIHGWVTTYLKAWDAQITIEDAQAVDDKVMVRWTMRATHKGDYVGIPPSHRQVTFTALEWLVLENGKIREMWCAFDTLGIVQQLGVIPRGDPPRALLQFLFWLRRLGRK